MKSIRRYIILWTIGLLACPAMAQNIVVDSIRIAGNKKTKESIILHELVFAKGDTFALADLTRRMDRSRENLLNTSLFNYVYVTDSLKGNKTIININVEERWYIWPVVDLVFEDRNISTWIRHPNWTRFSFGAGVNIENMRGLNEKLGINARFGYEWGVSLSYSQIAIDKARNHLLSFMAAYNIVHNTSYETVNNKVQYLTIEGEPIRERLTTGITYSYREELRSQHAAGLYFEHTQIADTLLKLNSDYWGGHSDVRNSINANYTYTSDYRDSRTYPLNGTVWRVGTTGSFALDGSLAIASLSPEINTYWQFAKRWFYAGELSGKLSIASTHSYTSEGALGYGRSYLRGYEDYVMDGQHFVLLKNTIRFLVMPTKTLEIKWLSALYKFNKIHFTLYANVFGDAGYAYNKYATPSNTLENVFLYSGGAGLDLVTYYDIVIRVDYSINKMGTGGFYVTLFTPFF